MQRCLHNRFEICKPVLFTPQNHQFTPQRLHKAGLPSFYPARDLKYLTHAGDVER